MVNGELLINLLKFKSLTTQNIKLYSLDNQRGIKTYRTIVMYLKFRTCKSAKYKYVMK